MKIPDMKRWSYGTAYAEALLEKDPYDLVRTCSKEFLDYINKSFVQVELQWYSGFDTDCRFILSRINFVLPANFRAMDNRVKPETRRGPQGYVYVQTNRNIDEFISILPDGLGYNSISGGVRLNSFYLAVGLLKLGKPLLKYPHKISRYQKIDLADAAFLKWFGAQ